jgi:hypothetical protein
MFEQLIREYLIPLRTTFTVAEHYRFLHSCEKHVPKGQTLEQFMDALAAAAKSPTYTQEFIMAKKEVAPATTAQPAKAAPKVKAAPAAGAPKAPAVAREPKIPATAKIVWLVKENPKRAGTASHERFEQYFGTKTVEAFLAAGGTRADLANDTTKEYMSIA